LILDLDACLGPDTIASTIATDAAYIVFIRFADWLALGTLKLKTEADSFGFASTACWILTDEPTDGTTATFANSYIFEGRVTQVMVFSAGGPFQII
jgi:hypothetical protein